VALDWEDLLARLESEVGKETEPTFVEVEKSMIRAFARATGATSRLYFDEDYARRSRFRGIIAPPAFVSTFIEGHIPEIFHFTDDLPHSLHSDDQAQIRRPIRAGDRIKAFARYAGAFRKTGRHGPMLFQNADLILEAAGGEQVATVRITTVAY
jgi:acyl dehydratase